MRNVLLALFLLGFAFLLLKCTEDAFMDDLKMDQSEVTFRKKGGPPTGETAGNNLSFPVIWSDGVTKTLPGTEGMAPVLNGQWWYQWGTNGVDPNITPASCPPDPDDPNLEDEFCYCDDGIPGSLTKVAGEPAADNPLPLARAYLQKDQYNTWQAGSADWSNSPVDVHWVDWGDNLESVDWYTKSQVRTEVVLFEDLDEPMTEYEMRHTSGWGIDEVHGLAADPYGVPAANQIEGYKATVYSHCARLTIQKLFVDRDDPRLADLVWVPGQGWTEPAGYPDDLIGDHLFNGSVHEGGDGPGYYSAEINVKGRIIYGYTWNVSNLNDGAGDYRITFSFDDLVNLNTYFTKDVTNILYPTAEELALAALAEADDSEEGGATGVLDYDNNLTYIDVRILQRGGGGGGGSGKGGGKGGTGGGKGGTGGNPGNPGNSSIGGDTGSTGTSTSDTSTGSTNNNTSNNTSSGWSSWLSFSKKG